MRVKTHQPGIVIETAPLTREAFAPFGDVVENPRPDIDPSSRDKPTSLPFEAVIANQGSAIKYQHVSHQINLYDQSPSGRPASAIMSMFVCAARASMPNPGGSTHDHLPPSTFPITVLERHPYTTQTFIPLTADPNAHYLVIVAPSLASTPSDTASFPSPVALPPSAKYPRALPGSGMPDLHGLRAFVATASQAVTYGAGIWHAPMVALGEKGTAVNFVVVQYANGVGLEDCQEVYLKPEGAGSAFGDEGAILARLRPVVGKAKL